MAAESPAGKAGRTGTHSGHRKLQAEPRPTCPVPLCLQGDKLLREKLPYGLCVAYDGLLFVAPEPL